MSDQILFPALGLAADSQAVIVGASGGIGGACHQALTASGQFARVLGLARSFVGDDHVDLTDEASLVALAARVAGGPDLRMVIVASGLLHRGEDLRPEKALRDLEPAALADLFAVNAIGPALVAKHLTPLFPRNGKSVFAVLSARVGSIGDNHLGGWYGYRASKAASNMMVRSLAIELARTRPDAVCLSLHPGTVATALSAPFRSKAEGDWLLDPGDCARRLIEVIARRGPVDSGGFFDFNNQPIDW